MDTPSFTVHTQLLTQRRSGGVGPGGLGKASLHASPCGSLLFSESAPALSLKMSRRRIAERHPPHVAHIQMSVGGVGQPRPH
jgi:hypothetical protein